MSVLSRGGTWTNVDIANVFINEYNEPNMNNTIAKYLSFMIRDGLVRSSRVHGKSYSEYELIVAESDDVKRYSDIAETYPDGHIERKKIEIQIESMRKFQAA